MIGRRREQKSRLGKKRIEILIVINRGGGTTESEVLHNAAVDAADWTGIKLGFFLSSVETDVGRVAIQSAVCHSNEDHYAVYTFRRKKTTHDCLENLK